MCVCVLDATSAVKRKVLADGTYATQSAVSEGVKSGEAGPEDNVVRAVTISAYLSID
jgi:hypothetical protein